MNKQYRKINLNKIFELLLLTLLFVLIFKPLQLLYLVFGLEYLIFISMVESILLWEIFLKPIWRVIK